MEGDTMRRVGQTLTLLCVLALVAILAGCGSSHGPNDTSAVKPPKPPPDEGGMMNPDIVYVMDDTLYVMSEDGSETIELPKPRKAYDYYPSWSPEGDMIAFKRCPDDNTTLGDICIIGVEGDPTAGYTFSEARVVCSPYSYGAMAWLGNDTVVFTEGNSAGSYRNLTAVNVNTLAVQTLSDEDNLNLVGWDSVYEVPRWAYLGSPSVAPDPDGTGYILAYNANEWTAADRTGTDVCLVKVIRDSSTGLWVRTDDDDPDDFEYPVGPTAVLRRLEAQTGPALSRDGTTLAFKASPYDASPGLCTLPIDVPDAAGWGLELSDNDLANIRPGALRTLARLTWSPGNEWIAFAVVNGDRPGGTPNLDLVRISSLGGEVTYLTTDTKHIEMEADWRWPQAPED
jgi:hypothetical protein